MAGPAQSTDEVGQGKAQSVRPSADKLLQTDEQLQGSLSTAAPTAPNTLGGQRKQRRNYLLRPDYRKTSILALIAKGEAGARQFLANVRWGKHGEGKQVCPKCGSIDTHYWCESVSRWKCRDKTCGKQFTIFSGTRFHNMRIPSTTFLSIMLHFVEAKDSISSRELSGLHNLDHQTAHVMTLKTREAIRETMSAEPRLVGFVQADAAYFLKYVRPGNVGTGASLSAKRDQKNAGLDEDGKAKQTVNPTMHALVVFVQSGALGERRYKVAVIKTENQVDLLTLGQRFCEQSAFLVTDQHSAYNFYTGEFDAHFRVNHSKEFMSKDGHHTNHAEGFFARLRAAQGGAWHRLTLQYLEEYGWEFAWRQTMAGRPNLQQLEDLLRRVLNHGRANRFVDYWNKRKTPKDAVPADEQGTAVEVRKGDVRKKRGRPTKESARMQEPPKPKRAYRRKSKAEPAGQ